MMVASNDRAFYCKVIDELGHPSYFKGRARSIDDFKEIVRSYYAINIDPVDACNLQFEYISDVPRVTPTKETFVEL